MVVNLFYAEWKGTRIMTLESIKGLITRDVNESDRRAVFYSAINDPCVYCKESNTIYCLSRCVYRRLI